MPNLSKMQENLPEMGIIAQKRSRSQTMAQICINLVGPYKINQKGCKKPLILRAVTIIDPATGWFEIHEYDDKWAITIANILEQEWLAQYPKPSLITFDHGNEFMGQEFRKTVNEEYGIKTKPITVRNLQANVIIEHIHQTMANMVQTLN